MVYLICISLRVDLCRIGRLSVFIVLLKLRRSFIVE